MTSTPAPLVGDSIRSRMDEFSPSERRVARVLLADYPSAGLDTVAGLAKRAGVSNPSVLRFIQRIGFKRYAQFQNELRDELSVRDGGPAGRYVELPAQGAVSEAVQAGANQLIEDTRRTISAIPERELTAVVDLLADTNRPVVISGGRVTRVVADRLVELLNRVRPRVRLIDDPWHQSIDTLIDVRRNVISVIVDIRRYDQDSIDFAAHMHEHGAKVVLITDEWLSPAARHADVVLPVSSRSPSPFDTISSAVVLVEALLPSIISRIGPRAHSRMQSWEHIERNRLVKK